LAQNQEKTVHDVRIIETAAFSLSEPVGLVFSPAEDALLMAMSDGQILAVDRLTGKPTSGARTGLAPRASDVVFVPSAGNFYAYDRAAQALVEIEPDAGLQAQFRRVIDLQQLALGQVKGLAVDPVSGRMFILDTAGPYLITLSPDVAGRSDLVVGQDEGRVQRMALPIHSGNLLRGLAYDPVSKHLFVLNPTEQLLIELSVDGQPMARYDLSAMPLANPRGMVFAPSGDPTDAPAQTSLYVVDGSSRTSPGQTTPFALIVELSLEPKQAQVAAAASQSAVLVNVIDTAAWSIPSPDPAGVAYWPATNGLLISDSEVDEMSIYEGVNIYEATLAGALLGTCTTLPEPAGVAKEPTGVAINPDNGHIFFSDDSADEVFEIDLGPDGQYCTADDIRTSFDTATFESLDPEGVAYGAGSVFVIDGVSQEVYRVRPGSNGVFDGLPPAGDDAVTSFDTSKLGLRDPEGIDYNPDNNTLFLLSRLETAVLETTLEGEPVYSIDFAFLEVIAPAGVAYGPRSTDPNAKSLYISDRAIDNKSNPKENDGKVFELGFTPWSPPLSSKTYLPLTLARRP
jgi:DNA-binding beta-propeller fold protein YncE